MSFAYVKNGQVVQTFSSDSFEVDGQYIHSAGALSKLEQINLGLYEFKPAAAVTLKYEKIESTVYDVDVGQGVVTESFVIVPFSAEELASAKAQAKQDVDNWADTARLSYVSPGVYTQQEYVQAETEARTWLEDTTKPCPISITCWATAKGWDHEEAAEDIVATAELFRNLLMGIRSIRLIGKAGVDAATDGTQLAAAIAQVKASLAALPNP